MKAVGGRVHSNTRDKQGPEENTGRKQQGMTNQRPHLNLRALVGRLGVRL